MSEVNTLTQIHEAILAELRARFTDRVTTFTAYQLAATEPIDTPALLLDLDLGEVGRDTGDERLPVALSWTLYCLLSSNTDNPELQVREFAIEATQAVYRSQFGLPGVLSMPRDLIAGPAAFRGGDDGYAAWWISWTCDAHVGRSIWSGTAVPDRVWLGFEPNVGPDHVDDYVQVASLADLPQI